MADSSNFTAAVSPVGFFPGHVEPTLRRAVPADRECAIDWLLRSDLAAEWHGPPLYADRPLPQDAQIDARLPWSLFDGRSPYGERGWMIGAGGQDVGFIHQHAIDLKHGVVELAIWLAARRLCRRGLGSQALVLLCERLQRELGVDRFVLRPSRRNVLALRALRRAGFRDLDLDDDAIRSKLGLTSPTYGDSVLMYRALSQPGCVLARRQQQRYVFIDSEFTDFDQPELISVAAVDEQGGHFYREIAGWPAERSSDFVQHHVAPLLDGVAVAKAEAARAFRAFLDRLTSDCPVTLVSDSGFDRWALAALLEREDLPAGVGWLRVAVPPLQLDAIAQEQGLRRHHALDDARALRQALLFPG